MHKKSGELMKNGSIRKSKFKENIYIFRCPICKAKIDIRDLKDMVCLNGHCFNIARKGYVNFLSRPVKTEYDEEMFHSRNTVCESGFFDPMLNCISDFIIGVSEKDNVKDIKILDAGCGQGFHLGQVVSRLYNRTDSNVLGAGIDISKEGILMASKSYFDIIWCVGDLARIPFRSRQFSIIFNILSPANYGEFGRVLKDDGILIKVVPGSNYLKELRDVFYDKLNKNIYSNKKVIRHYSKHFNILDVIQVSYNKKIGKKDFTHFIKMTPLSWSATDSKIEQALNMKINDITADFTVIIGNKG